MGIRRNRCLVVGALVVGCLAPAVPASGEEPVVPERIAFVSDRASADRTDIWLMATDGSDPTRFTYELQSEWSPTWSADGGSIAYEGANGVLDPFQDGNYLDFNGHIFEFDGATRTTLASAAFGGLGGGSTTYAQPAFSATGDLAIVVTHTEAGSVGTNPPVTTISAPLSFPELPDPSDPTDRGRAPTWSPDGTSLAFEYDGDIYVVTDGSADYTVVAEGAGSPEWSPDGSWIAYSSGGDLYKVPAAGGDAVQLTSGTGVDTEPTWSPDSTEVAFASDRDGNWEIYRVAADGVSSPVNLTDAPDSDETSPDWSGPCTPTCVDLQAPATPPDTPSLQYVGPRGSSLEFVILPSYEGTAPQTLEITPSTSGVTSPVTDLVYRLAFADIPFGGPFTLTLTASNAAGSSEPFTYEGSLGCPAFADFPDVPSWVADAANWLGGVGLMTGFPDGTFRPLSPVTRAQVARVLYRLAGSPDVSGLPAHGFGDVPAWADDAVTWIVDEGAMGGFANGFRPNRTMNRGAVAQALYQLEGAPDVSGLPAHDFTDVPSRLDDAVTWIVGTGLADGFPDDTFRPSRPTTRGALANILYTDTCLTS